jgi:two-component system chemotaxis sensor kinase CheA
MALASDDRFREMFFEEARELLIGLEEGLVELERRQGDRAHIDRTFRAAHSLKGAAAMVGLSAIAGFTHGLETVLDRIRSGLQTVDAGSITTLLEARDHLAAMVEAEANQASIPVPADLAQRVADLLASGPAAAAPPPAPELAPASPGEGRTRYRVTFRPGPGLLRRGVNPLGVLDELRDLGPTRVSTDPEAVPTLEAIDPERCYLSWVVEVETDAPPARFDDVFLLVAGDSEVAIERLPGPLPVEPSAPPPAPPPAPEAPAHEAASSPARPAPRIRVDAHQLDDLVGLAGELAVLSDNLQGLREVAGADPWQPALEALDRVSRQVRDTTLDLRMVPVDELFSRFPRVVRDLADRSGKEIELRIVGQETRLDRTIVERLSDPMIHLIRNAVDHGLEPPDERAARGKPRRGRITLSAGHEGDQVAVRVEDDGRGLDRERIVRKAIDLGLAPPGTPADDPRVDDLIFEPGFSTRDRVNELSGRGVGLDVVRDAARGLRGSLAVQSRPGLGTAFTFRMPLTLALIDGLLVESAGCRYVVPLSQVEECVAFDAARPALARGRPCVEVRGELVPTVPLRTLFRVGGEPPARQELLLTRHAGQRVGVMVDKLVGRVEAVIQALGEGLQGVGRFSGATILGDGSVSLILDLAALVGECRAADQPRPGPTATPVGGAEAYR